MFICVYKHLNQTCFCLAASSTEGKMYQVVWRPWTSALPTPNRYCECQCVGGRLVLWVSVCGWAACTVHVTYCGRWCGLLRQMLVGLFLGVGLLDLLLTDVVMCISKCAFVGRESSDVLMLVGRESCSTLHVHRLSVCVLYIQIGSCTLIEYVYSHRIWLLLPHTTTHTHTILPHTHYPPPHTILPPHMHTTTPHTHSCWLATITTTLSCGTPSLGSPSQSTAPSRGRRRWGTYWQRAGTRVARNSSPLIRRGRYHSGTSVKRNAPLWSRGSMVGGLVPCCHGYLACSQSGPMYCMNYTWWSKLA